LIGAGLGGNSGAALGAGLGGLLGALLGAEGDRQVAEAAYRAEVSSKAMAECYGR
jgi:hypothetical protein